MKLIEVTEPGGQKIVINATYILKITPSKGEDRGASIQMIETGMIHVKETVSEIWTAITGASKG
jgi:hypothetical protein